MKRVLLGLLLVVVLILGIAWFSARRYVQSEHVAAQVASKLKEVYGGQVEIKQVDVGLGGSSLSGFKLYEKDADAKYVWLEIESLNTDMSLWDIIRGDAMPHHVSVERATVTLRFDHEGNLLTRFPVADSKEQPSLNVETIPLGAITRSQVVFKKAGYADIVVNNLSATLERQENQMVLAGGGENAELGKLVLQATLDAPTARVVAHLKTDGPAHVTQAELLRLPFIPESVWEEVQIKEATTGAAMTANYDLKSRTLHYHVELAPTKTTLFIPALDVQARDASGKVVIDDYKVELRDFAGSAFDGSLKMWSDLDFEGDVIHLKFTHVEVANADVNTFPASWKFPPNIKGRFTGGANMDITVRTEPVTIGTLTSVVGLASQSGEFGFLRTASGLLAGKPRHDIKSSGEGKGKILGATIGGQPVEEFTIDWLPAPGGFDRRAKTSREFPGNLNDVMLALLAAHSTLVFQSAAEPEINLLLGRWMGEIVGGAKTAARDIVEAGIGIFERIPKKIDVTPAKPGALPQYLEVNLKLKQINLAEFVKGLNVNLPYEVGGKASFQVKASLPIDQPGDLKAYKIHGTAQVTDFRIADVRLAEIQADVTYLDGNLKLEGLKGRFVADKEDAGGFRGGATMQVVPLGNLDANLTLERVPAAQFAQLAESKLPMTGFVSGQISANASSDKFKDARAWEAKGTLTSDRLSVSGLNMTDVAAEVRLKEGVFAVTEARGQLEGAPVKGSAEMKLDVGYPYVAKLSLQDWNVNALKRLDPDFRPAVELAGSFGTTVAAKGTLMPFTANVSGNASAQELKIEAFVVKSAKFHWEMAGNQLVLANLVANLYGGEATGGATVPLTAKAAGSVDLRIANLDTREVAKAFPIPFKIEGHVDGALKGTLPPAAEGKERTAQINLDLKAPKLRVQNIPTEQLHGTLEYKKGVLDYKLEGKSLGGTFELEGQVPHNEVPAAKQPKQSRVSIQGVRLSRLASALNIQGLSPLGGLLNIDFHYSLDPKDRIPHGSGQVRLVGLRWGDTVVSNNLQGNIDVANGVARLRELSATIAGGQFRAQVSSNLRNPERSFFVVNFDNAEAAQLLAPFLGDAVEGTLHGRIKGNLGATWSGTADIELTRGKIHGLDVTSWRAPIEWQFAPGQNRGQIQIADSSAQVARGRATGRVNVYWDYSARVDGEVKFYGVDVQSLLRKTGSAQLAGGQMTGHFGFEGRDVRSFEDLSGLLTASFSQSQPLQVPVLSQLAPYLGIGPTTTFQKGALLARLGRGVLRIQHLNLEGGTYQLFIDGNVTAHGRLDLAVTAQLGNLGLPTDRFRLLGLRIPAVGPLPVALAIEASNLLSNRAIYLQVTGTVSNPVIRALPVPILTDNALRYFITKSVPVPFTPFGP